jgi:hypothetical protein
MGRGLSRNRRRRRYIVGSLLVSLAAALVVSCVIAEPPSDLPRLPETRPTILRGQVVPSAGSVLGRWPQKFTVPVELIDPKVTFLYSAFIDYNPATGEGLDPGFPASSEFEQGTQDGRVRTLEIPISTPALDQCHTVEIIVALRLNTTDPRNAHTPLPPGGDSVTWFFSPSGDLSGCPVLDAGIAPPVGDAEVEGGPQ